MAKIGRTFGAGLCRRLLERVARRPEFRTSIFLCIVWLLALQAYQPWRLFRSYKPTSLFEQAAFFLWRVGFNVAENGPVAVTVGLALIILLVYTLGWVVRSFTSMPSSSVTGRGTSKLDATDAPNRLDGFMNLCHSIRLNCWQHIQANSSREANAQVLRAAYNDYKGQVSPWLSIIIDTSRSESQIVKQARNRAAECLSSLAGGFVCLGDFDAALTLGLEARQLVIDDEMLEAEIKARLDLIASENQDLGNSASRSAAAVGTPEPKMAARSLSGIQGNSRIRLPLILAGIVLLIAIPVLNYITRDEQSAAANTTPRGEWQGPTAPVAGPKYDPSPVSNLKPTPYAPMPGPSAQLPRNPVSLPNGTDLIPPKNVGGRCELKISNYTDRDAAVKLKTSADRTTVRFVYVQTMNDVTLSNIVPGEYVLQFATGRDWDAAGFVFRQDLTFKVFDKALSFSERRVADTIEFSTSDITLHAVPDGNVQTNAISAEEFSDDLGVYH